MNPFEAWRKVPNGGMLKSDNLYCEIDSRGTIYQFIWESNTPAAVTVDNLDRDDWEVVEEK